MCSCKILQFLVPFLGALIAGARVALAAPEVLGWVLASVARVPSPAAGTGLGLMAAVWGIHLRARRDVLDDLVWREGFGAEAGTLKGAHQGSQILAQPGLQHPIGGPDSDVHLPSPLHHVEIHNRSLGRCDAHRYLLRRR
jgi:hypothetical protein